MCVAAGVCGHVDVGVVGGLAGDPAPDLQCDGIALRAVLQAMAVRIAGLEPGALAGAQQFGAIIGDERHFAGEDIDEFVLALVPVALARPGAGRQA